QLGVELRRRPPADQRGSGGQGEPELLDDRGRSFVPSPCQLGVHAEAPRRLVDQVGVQQPEAERLRNPGGHASPPRAVLARDRDDGHQPGGGPTEDTASRNPSVRSLIPSASKSRVATWQELFSRTNCLRSLPDRFITRSAFPGFTV